MCMLGLVCVFLIDSEITVIGIQAIPAPYEGERTRLGEANEGRGGCDLHTHHRLAPLARNTSVAGTAKQ